MATRLTSYSSIPRRKELPMDESILQAQDYQDAIDLQDACNPIAMINTLQKAMEKVEKEVGKNGMSAVVAHPIIRLLMYKCFSMVYPEPFDDDRIADMFGNAYHEARKAILQLQEQEKAIRVDPGIKILSAEEKAMELDQAVEAFYHTCS